MRRTAYLLLISICCAGPPSVASAGAQHGTHSSIGAHVARLASPSALTVSFYPAPDGARLTSAGTDGVLNLGNVSSAGAAAASGISVKEAGPGFVVETQLGLKVGPVQAAGSAAATVTFSAWLRTTVAPYSIYLDGILLGVRPALINPRQPIGGITTHTLRIMVPADSNEKIAQLVSNIAVQVQRN